MRILALCCAVLLVMTGCSLRSSNAFDNGPLEGPDVSHVLQWMYEQEEVVAAVGEHRAVENTSSQRVSAKDPLRIGSRKDTLTITGTNGTAVLQYEISEIEKGDYEVAGIRMLEPQKIDFLQRYRDQFNK